MAFEHKISSRRPANIANSTAFSLIEMMVVIAVMTVLLMLASGGKDRVVQSYRMEQAGRVIVDEINLARQIAISRNLNIELRFIEKRRTNNPGGNPVFYCLQSGILSKTGSNGFTPVTHQAELPDGVALSPETNLSSIIGLLPKSESTSPAYRYVSIVIRPTGNLEPQTGLSLKQLWFVTALPENKMAADIAKVPNFVTVQIDPWTSLSTTYRP